MNFRKTSWEKSDLGCAARSRHLDSLRWLLWLPGRRIKVAQDSFAVGVVCSSRGNVPLAETNFLRVLRLLEGGSPGASKKSLARYSLVAGSRNHLGLLFLNRGKAEQAAMEFDKAIALRRELLRLFPKERENEVYLGGALCNRGHACADSDPASAALFYEESLRILRQPVRTCECSYWDANRESWWCEQLEALGQCLGLEWVKLAPQFIDNAKQGLASLKPTSG